MVYRAPGFRITPEAGTALLPFENRSSAPEAGRVVADLFRGAFHRTRHARVPENSEVLAAMVRQRMRSIGHLDAPAMAKLAGDLGVRQFLVGTVTVWDAREGEPDGPEVEISARLLEPGTGRGLWASLHHRRGNDYHLLLDLGRIDSVAALAERVAEEMVESLAGK